MFKDMAVIKIQTGMVVITQSYPHPFSRHDNHNVLPAFIDQSITHGLVNPFLCGVLLAFNHLKLDIVDMHRVRHGHVISASGSEFSSVIRNRSPLRERI